MNLREATALIRLYEACADPVLRRWAITMVPELDDVASKAVPPSRWHLLAWGNDRVYPLGSKIVICNDDCLEDEKRSYANGFAVAANVTVRAEPL